MFSKKISVVMVAVMATFLASCSQPIVQANDAVIGTPKTESQRYVDNVLKLYHSFPSARTAARTASSEVVSSDGAETVGLAPADYFDGLTIYTDETTKTKFSDLSERDREGFLNYWAKVRQELLQKDLSETPSLVQNYQDINESMDQAFAETSRAAVGPQEGFTLFAKRFSEINGAKQALPSQPGEPSLNRSSSSGSATSGTLESVRDVNVNAVAALRSSYQKGRVLISQDGGFGHASMMAKNSWDPAWETDGGSMIAITSFAAPSGSKNYWGGPDGVQYEPLGAWAGKNSNAAKQVKVVQPANHCWSYYIEWNWFSTTVRQNDWWELPNSAMTNQAVSFAESMLGHAYCIGTDILNNKRPTIPWTYVCSSLAWASWASASGPQNYTIELDGSWFDTWVTPSEIASTDDRRDIITYQNNS